MYFFCSLVPQRALPRARYPIQPAELWPEMPRLYDEVEPAPLVFKTSFRTVDSKLRSGAGERGQERPANPPAIGLGSNPSQKVNSGTDESRKTSSETCKASCDEASRLPGDMQNYILRYEGFLACECCSSRQRRLNRFLCPGLTGPSLPIWTMAFRKSGPASRFKKPG